MKYYLYIDECGDNNLKNFDEQFPIPITRHILDPNEPNMAYDVIKNNIYTENMKQVGIKIIPNT